MLVCAASASQNPRSAPRGSKRQPGGIGLVGRAGAGREPAAPFDMAVGKGEIGGALMPGGGQVGPATAVEMVEEIPVVDAVGMLFDEDEDGGGPGNLGQAEELAVSGDCLSCGRSRRTGRIPHHWRSWKGCGRAHASRPGAGDRSERDQPGSGKEGPRGRCKGRFRRGSAERSWCCQSRVPSSSPAWSSCRTDSGRPPV